MSLPSTRRFSGVADMIRSLGVVLVFAFVVLMIGAGRVLLFPGHRPVAAPVDFATQVRLASAAAGVGFLSPASLPPGWQAVSVELSPGAPVTLRIGFSLPGSGFVSMVQRATRSAGASRAFCAQQLRLATLCRAGRPVTIKGRVWTTGHDSQGEASLRDYANGLSVVLISTAGPAPLSSLADRLA